VSRRLYITFIFTLCLAASSMVSIAMACGGEPELCEEAPTATTQAATGVLSRSATLHGSVNPQGCSTTYEFRYGLKAGEYPYLAGSGNAGSGKSNVSEEVTYAAFLPGTTYHYHITATSFAGSADGGDQTFTTLAEEPSVTTEAATSVTKTGATLNGSVNANGESTSYYFEYGLTTSYEKTTGSGSVSGTSSEKVSKAITGLDPGTTYHFRIVATNGHGTKKGSDKTFETKALTSSIQTVSNPTGAKSSRFYSISCTSASACTSVGEYVNGSSVQVPLAERWNGEKWSAQSPPSPGEATSSELLGVSCTTSTACAASGSYVKGGVRRVLVEVWNGLEWSVQTAAEPAETTSAELSTISCTSSTACTAVGRYTAKGNPTMLAERWDGTKWTIQTTPSPSEAKESSLLGVSCTSSTSCVATGYYYNNAGTRLTLAEIWNGSEWSVQTTSNREGATKNILLGVSCTSSTACTAVGADNPSGGGPQETLVERLSGSKWTIESSPNPSGSEASVLHGVSCTSATLCVTVGDYVNAKLTNVTLAERWNGNSWSLESTTDPAGATFSALWSVACPSGVECVESGYYKDGSGVDWALTEKSS